MLYNNIYHIFEEYKWHYFGLILLNTEPLTIEQSYMIIHNLHLQ